MRAPVQPPQSRAGPWPGATFTPSPCSGLGTQAGTPTAPGGARDRDEPGALG